MLHPMDRGSEAMDNHAQLASAHRARSARATRPRGFTLVELLVVISIVGVLVALLLPAVQSARESARRASCQNNLHQVGLAALAYESQRDALPVGCIECRAVVALPNQPRFVSWIVQVLPGLEQQAVYDRLDLDAPMWDASNQEPTSVVLPELLCPSTPAEEVRSGVFLWRDRAFTDYGGLYGVEGQGHNVADFAATQTLADAYLGVMLYEVPTTLRQITDGTSHTAMVGEMQLRRRGSECEWANGHHLFAQEKQTPINGRSGLGNDIGSPHPGGAQVLFCDGHVAWLADDLEQHALRAILTRSGDEVLPTQ